MMVTTPRDFFECEYARRHMSADPFREAKQSLEENRHGDTYSDEGLARAWEDFLMGQEW
jgi:hypothetical protein